MEITAEKQKEYYEIVLNSLAGMEDDLLASEVPIEAVDYVRKALVICNADFKARFSSK